MAIATVNCMGRGIASNLLWMSWKLQPKGEGEEGAKGIGQLHLPTLLIIHRYISRESGNDGGISDVMYGQQSMYQRYSISLGSSS